MLGTWKDTTGREGRDIIHQPNFIGLVYAMHIIDDTRDGRAEGVGQFIGALFESDIILHYQQQLITWLFHKIVSMVGPSCLLSGLELRVEPTQATRFADVQSYIGSIQPASSSSGKALAMSSPPGDAALQLRRIAELRFYPLAIREALSACRGFAPAVVEVLRASAADERAVVEAVLTLVCEMAEDSRAFGDGMRAAGAAHEPCVIANRRALALFG